MTVCRSAGSSSTHHCEVLSGRCDVRSRLPTLPSGHPEKILRTRARRANSRLGLRACGVGRDSKRSDASPFCGAPLHGEDQGRVAGWETRIRTWTNHVWGVLSARLLTRFWSKGTSLVEPNLPCPSL